MTIIEFPGARRKSDVSKGRQPMSADQARAAYMALSPDHKVIVSSVMQAFLGWIEPPPSA
jgi:hypothetical protein